MDELQKTADMSPVALGSFTGSLFAPATTNKTQSFLRGAGAGLLGSAVGGLGFGGLLAANPLLAGTAILGGSLLGGLSGLWKSNDLQQQELMRRQVEESR